MNKEIMASQNLAQGCFGCPKISLRAPRRLPRRSLTVKVCAQRRQQDHVADVSAAFVLSLGSLLTASAVSAATTEKALSSFPAAASAQVPDAAVDQATNQIIAAIKAAAGAVKSGLDVAADGAFKAKDAADQAAPYVRKGIENATPYAKTAADYARQAAEPLITAITPVFQNGIDEVQFFLNKQGINADLVAETTRSASSKAEQAISAATPTVGAAATTLSTSTPQQLGQYALGLAGVYFLGPRALKGLFGSLRGYAGEISAASALDSVANDPNSVIIDIRTSSEKEYTGIPDVPNSNRLIELEYAQVSDRKIRGLLRNVGDVEKQITVLQIDALKKVKKGSKILLLDKNGGGAKDIARGLRGKGYKRVFVISGGFNGWSGSKLQTRPSSSASAVEILGPIFGTGRSDRTGTRSTRGDSDQWARIEEDLIGGAQIIDRLFTKECEAFSL